MIGVTQILTSFTSPTPLAQVYLLLICSHKIIEPPHLKLTRALVWIKKWKMNNLCYLCLTFASKTSVIKIGPWKCQARVDKQTYVKLIRKPTAIQFFILWTIFYFSQISMNSTSTLPRSNMAPRNYGHSHGTMVKKQTPSVPASGEELRPLTGNGDHHHVHHHGGVTHNPSSDTLRRVRFEKTGGTPDSRFLNRHFMKSSTVRI